jgi:RND family efflux transporter MFP subunit
MLSKMMKTQIITLLLLLGLLAGCGEQAADNKPKQRAQLVELATVVADTLSLQQRRTGTLRARREVNIHTQEEGQVAALPYYEGDHVKQGDVLVRLDDVLLNAQLDKARATLRQAQQDLARLQTLSKRKLVSSEQLLGAETRLQVARSDLAVLETRLGYTRILAPFDGVITARLTEPGNVVERHQHVLTISDPASLVTELTVSELVLPHLVVGDTAEVQIDALGEARFTGRITRIHPEIDRLSRRGTVEVELDPVPGMARPGQLCRVMLSTRSARRTVIPFDAVRRDDTGEYVYRVTPENKADKVNITIGLHLADKVEVLSGLKPGDRIVLKGFMGLTPGKPVKPVKPGNKKQAADGA